MVFKWLQLLKSFFNASENGVEHGIPLMELQKGGYKDIIMLGQYLDLPTPALKERAAAAVKSASRPGAAGPLAGAMARVSIGPGGGIESGEERMAEILLRIARTRWVGLALLALVSLLALLAPRALLALLSLISLLSLIVLLALICTARSSCFAFSAFFSCSASRTVMCVLSSGDRRSSGCGCVVIGCQRRDGVVSPSTAADHTCDPLSPSRVDATP